MRRVGRRTLTGATWLAGISAACASLLIPLEELPEAPIAILYRTHQEARERADRLAEASEAGGQRSGVVDLSDLERSRDREAGPELPRRLAGRPALLDPRTGSVRVIDSLRRGTVPLGWSRDRSSLLIAARRASGWTVSELVLESLDLRPVTREPAWRASAVYGPDQRLALSAAWAGDSSGTRIYVTEPGGRSPRPITRGPHDRSPVWSPDGGTIAFVTGVPDRDEAVAVIDASGEGEVRRLGPGRDPAFTPDGAWIVYAARRREGLRLWRMRPDGSGRTALGLGRTDEMKPTPSPDGRFVAYISLEDGRQSLRVRRFDGSGDRILLTDGDAAHPVW